MNEEETARKPPKIISCFGVACKNFSGILFLDLVFLSQNFKEGFLLMLWVRLNFHMAIIVWCLLALLGNCHQVHAQANYYRFSYQPSSATDELKIGVTHTLWIPESVDVLRGIIVHQHGCGEGACRSGEVAAQDLHWQELARKWNCALLGPRYHQNQEQNCRLWCDPRNGSADVFLKSLEALAERSGHPELAHVPWCLWGHSGGGFWASIMQMLYPERIVAIWFQSGTAYNRWTSGEIEAPSIPAAAMKIPMVACPGFEERAHERFHTAYEGCFAMTQAYRQLGAPIAFAPDPLSGHETRDSRYLAIPFFDACLNLRLPSQAGDDQLRDVDLRQGVFTTLRENYSQVESLYVVKGSVEDPNLNWLPSAELAQKWADFIQTGAVSDNTPPPTPLDVTVDGQAISWQARADFESGLQAFAIIKDGIEIGRVPAASRSKFGRPLFQGNTYHDTPAFDQPEMHFVDGSNESGHYQVVSINSVGLRSSPASE